MRNHNSGDDETHDAPDVAVEEVSGLRLSLRGGLIFTPTVERGEPCYTVEDPLRAQFFRIGKREYRLMKSLDGQRSVRDVVAALATLDPNASLTETEAVSVCDWLIRVQLATTSTSNNGQQMASIAAKQAKQKRLAGWNPLCFRVPLTRPDSWMTVMTPWLSWMFGSVAGWCSALVMASAVAIMLPHIDSFAANTQETFVPGRWWILFLVWLSLKFVHELSHAVVCRKYGGNVAEAGLMMVFLAPLAYVDLTSAWRFRSKWARIHTAAAGMQMELLIAALAAIVWLNTSGGVVHNLSHHVVLLAGLTTLLFNANPLMRFDGYYILSDWMEIPNLYSEANQYLRYLGRRFVLGEAVSTSLSMNGRDVFVRVYAFAALAWRLLICVTMIVGASFLLNGLGIVLSVVAAVLWFGFPLVRFLRYVCRGDGLRRRRQIRLGMTCLGSALVVALVVGRVSWPGANVSAAIVSDESSRVVRATSAGFVAKLLVRPGQRVLKDEPIAVLENLQLKVELADLKLAIAQSELKSRVFTQADEIHRYQSEQSQLMALCEKQQQKQEQVDQLVLRSPMDGYVEARYLDSRKGTFLSVGDVLLTVAAEGTDQLRVMVPMEDYERYEKAVGQTSVVRLAGGQTRSVRLNSLDPRATDFAPHASMYASNGGMLANTRSEPVESSSAGSNDGSTEILLRPHFSALVTVEPSDDRGLYAGQRGVMVAPGRKTTIAKRLQEKFRETLNAWLLSSSSG